MGNKSYMKGRPNIDRIEISILSLREEFEQYRLRLSRAYECAVALLARREAGFSSPERAELYEDTLDDAIRYYFRLRAQIDWWQEQVYQIVATLTEIERQEELMIAPLPELDRQSGRINGFEEAADLPLVELDQVF